MELETIVLNFRKAIEVAKNHDEPGEFFRKFPVGQCGNASDMLAQYLIENGFPHITYVSGTYYGQCYDDRQTHAWLVVDGLIVDITADQFSLYRNPLKNETPVYVGPMNRYYQLFEVDPNGRCQHFGLEQCWSNYYELKKWYHIILKYL